jgi:transcriptional regulator GlxA family with amidase domain
MTAETTSSKRFTPSVAASNGRNTVLVGFEHMQALDLVGPLEVFVKANTHAAAKAGHATYAPHIATVRGGTVTTNSGLELAGTVALETLPENLDTILVAGGSIEAFQAEPDCANLIAWLVDAAPKARRIASICTGAFLLGTAGLLDGRRATTHWNACADLARLFGATQVVPDAIFVADGPIYSSAGVTAGIDLALALVEQDLGPQIALAVARDLVLPLRRSGGQSQFSASLAAQAQASDRLRNLLEWIAEDPTRDLSIPALADHVAMSERNFGRQFKAQTGVTPSDFVEAVRLDRAKMLLETADWPLARVAERSGFGSLSTMIRAFRRRLGLTPELYRARFRLPSLAEMAEPACELA